MGLPDLVAQPGKATRVLPARLEQAVVKALVEDFYTSENRHPPLNRRSIVSYGETRCHAIALLAW
jgi:hypothetical protein